MSSVSETKEEGHTLDYELPEENIAIFPLAQRDQSKLLVYKNHDIIHDSFTHLHEHIESDSLLVFNNTKVFKARLFFQTERGATVEIFCLEPAYGLAPELALTQKLQSTWVCLVGKAKKWKNGSLKGTFVFNDTLCAVKAILIERENELFTIAFSWENEDFSFSQIIEIAGELPLPPYIKRKAAKEDELRYQTVYALKEGSVAAPTAGLHFTDKVMAKLYEKNIDTAYLTLHVGAGTFKPINSAHYSNHIMHEEMIEVSSETIRSVLNHSTRVIAVGTTSLRTLESIYWMGVKSYLNPNINLQDIEIKQWEPYQISTTITLTQALHSLLNWMAKAQKNVLICKTQILITPQYNLKVAQGIITNFHQPKSTLLLIVAAVTGNDWRKIYQEALHHNYRFLSYGDSSLLMKNGVIT